jgi:hypothetical protein
LQAGCHQLGLRKQRLLSDRDITVPPHVAQTLNATSSCAMHKLYRLHLLRSPSFRLVLPSFHTSVRPYFICFWLLFSSLSTPFLSGRLSQFITLLNLSGKGPVRISPAIAHGVSHRLHTATAHVRAWIRSCGIICSLVFCL